MEILKNNLDNIKTEIDLFGNENKKLSMVDRIGFVPLSIWEPNWTITKQLKAVIGDEGQAREFTKHSDNWRSTGWSGKDKPQKISIYNPNLAQMILSAYCPTQAKIYDPFAGGGTRAIISAAMGHKYYGIELRNEEVERIIQKRQELKLSFQLRTGDSRTCWQELEKDSFDFSFTCPPYYKLEVYSDKEEDLSNAKSYKIFLEMVEDSLNGCFQLLKSGHLCIWTIGNFRDENGNLIYFNGDLVNIAKKIGFDIHDDIIFWGASKCAAQRSGQFQANRRSVRVHEHILIFRKPLF